VPLLAQPATELAGERGLAGALEAREHDDRRRALREPDLAAGAAEDLDELLVDHLEDLLGGVERLGDLGGQGPLTDGGREGADGRDGDVGVQQGAPDLRDGGVDVGLGQPSLAAQGLERRGEAVGQGGEHAGDPSVVGLPQDNWAARGHRPGNETGRSVLAPGARLVAGTTSDGRDGAGTEWCGRRPRPTYGCVPWGAPLRRRP